MAAATVVTLERDGAAVAGGEVCRFPAGDRVNPIERWLSSQETTCVAAGAPIELPGGLWNVYGRSDGAISNEPTLVDGASAPSYLTLQLVPAATLVPVLPAGQSAVVYAARRGVAYPAAARMSVPAAEALWVIVLEKEKKQPASITSVLPLEAGSERSVDARGAGVGAAVLAWLQFDEQDRKALAGTRGVALPHVRVAQNGNANDSDPLPPLELLDGALVLLRGVSAGDAILDAGGHGWLPERRRVKVAQKITVASQPLALRPAATLMVHWKASPEVRALQDRIGSCEPPQPPKFDISISSCATQQRPNDPLESCTVIRQQSFAADAQFGDVTVDDIPPGTYRAEMRFGTLPPTERVTRLTAFQQANVYLEPFYFELYGSLTRGGEPLGRNASLALPSGTGFATAEKSEYFAVIEHPLDPDAQIRVSTCDGKLQATVLSDGPVRPKARYDIDIPDNELAVEVSDTFTRAPLPGATVRVTVLSLRVPRHPVLERKLTTATSDEDGLARATLPFVPERQIILNVSLTGYQKQAVQPFTMPRSGKKTVEVQLVPLRGSAGKIVSARPFDDGSVIWFSSAGEETERVELAADGAFFYLRSHGPDETLAVVSRSHPLWDVRAPDVGRGQTIELRFPDAAPSRTFDVDAPFADPRYSRYVGLYVGGLRIPFGALQSHQGLRRLPWLVRGAGPLTIRDIAETAPIDVALGPTTEEVPGRVRDPFALPRYADAPRKRLESGAPRVVLGP